MERKAQGAIEYLLIMGAAILVVAIVLIAITSVMNQGKIATDQGIDAATKASNTNICQLNMKALEANPETSNCTKTTCLCCTDATKADQTKLTSVCR